MLFLGQSQGTKTASGTCTGLPQASAYIMFAYIPLAKASQWPSPESERVGTNKLQGKGCRYRKAVNTTCVSSWLRQNEGLFFFLSVKDVTRQELGQLRGVIKDPGFSAHSFLSLWAKMAARAPAITSTSRAAWKAESDKGGTPPFERDLEVPPSAYITGKHIVMWSLLAASFGEKGSFIWAQGT